MKQFFIIILCTIFSRFADAHTGVGMTQHYGNVEVFSFKNYNLEEFRKAFIIGKLAKKLADKLNYTDSIYLDFYHNHHKIDSLPYIYHLVIDRLRALGQIHKTGGEKIIVRQFANEYNVEETLKLLEYGLMHRKQIKQNQSIKNNATIYSSLVRSFLSISDAEIQQILQKPSSTAIKEVMQNRVDRPTFEYDSQSSISYYWQNDIYYLFRQQTSKQKNPKETIIMELPRIHTFYPLYPMTVVFENPASFYVIHPNHRDPKTGTYIPSKKQTISHMSNIDQGKKVSAISHDDISIFFRYGHRGFADNATRLLLYLSHADTLIQDAYALNDSLSSGRSYDELKKAEPLPKIYEHTTSWKKQLEFIIGQGKNDKNLRLVAYTDPDDRDSISIHDFNAETLVPTVSRIWTGIPDFFKRYRDPEKGREAYIQEHTEGLRRHQEMKDDLALVKLQWAYRDQIFYTYAVVSTYFDTLIYDDIISYHGGPGRSFMIKDLIRYSRRYR